MSLKRLIKLSNKIVDLDRIENPRLRDVLKERVAGRNRFLFNYGDGHTDYDKREYKDYSDHSEYGAHVDHTDSHKDKNYNEHTDYSDHHSDNWEPDIGHTDFNHNDAVYDHHTDEHTDSNS